MNTEKDVILFLNQIYFSNQRILQFIENDFIYHFIGLKKSQVENLEFLSDSEKDCIFDNLERFNIDRYKYQLYSIGINFTCIFDLNYPERLKNICNPPVILFYKGDLEDLKNTIAIVGSRKETEYGKWVVKKIVKELSVYDFTIISGMAMGVDRTAHLSALSNKLKTCGVLASSIDIQYPKCNMDLYSSMSDNLLVSEFGINTSPIKRNFVSRNRIISGLSDAVIVVEASEKSGSLITANFAIEQAREVYAVPGSINISTSKGCNDLIKKGAKLISCGQDLIDNLPYINELNKILPEQAFENLSTEEKELLFLLKGNILSVNSIHEKSNIPLSKLYEMLLNLEMKGYVERLDSLHYTYI